MDDLVARLRVARDMWLREREFIYNVHNSLYGQAANAIEQLAAERDALQAKLAAILNACTDLRNNVSDHKDYEGYAEGWIDACNECMWALQKEQCEQV